MKIETILKELIKFESISTDPKSNIPVLDWIHKKVSHLPLYAKEYEFNGWPSLVLTTRQTKKPKVLLQGHVDVVSGSPAVFKPRIVGNRLYGRGAFDMKFGVAAYVKLMLDLGDAISKYDLGFMFTSDEEIGGRNGVKKLVEKEGYRAKIVFLPDGGNDWKFERSSKGVLRVAVESHGKAAHGSRPWLGRDANAEISEYLAELTKEFQKLITDDPARIYPTLAIGMLHGGTTINQVPEYSEANLDIRMPYGYPAERMKKILEKVAKNHPHIKLRYIISSPGFEMDTDSYYHRLFSSIVQKIRRRKPGNLDTHGSSDARYFIKRNIPVMMIRPSGSGQHSENEWIDLPGLNTYYRCLSEFVKQAGL